MLGFYWYSGKIFSGAPPLPLPSQRSNVTSKVTRTSHSEHSLEKEVKLLSLGWFILLHLPEWPFKVFAVVLEVAPAREVPHEKGRRLFLGQEFLAEAILAHAKNEGS